MGARSTSVFRDGLLEDMISIALTGDRTLSVYEASNRSITFTGTLGGTATVTLPLSLEDEGLFWFVYNNTNQSIVFKSAAAGTGATITSASRAIVLYDGAEIQPNIAGTASIPELEGLTLHSATQPFRIATAVPATATGSLLSLTAAAVANGSANGNYLAANATTGFAGNFVQFEINSVNKFIVGASGAVSSAGFATFGAVSSQLGVITLYPTATDIGAVVKLAATPTANAVEVQPNASSTPILHVTKDGYLGIGAGAPGTTRAMHLQVNTSAVTEGVFIENIWTGAATTMSGIRGAAYSGPTTAVSVVAYGVRGAAFYRGTSATTQTIIAGGYFNCGIDGASPTGTVTSACALRLDSQSGSASGSPSVTFVTAIGLQVENQGAGATGITVQNSTGIFVKAQSGSGTVRAIHCQGGESLFQTGADGVVGIAVRANSGTQTAALLELRDSAGAAKISFGSLATVGNASLTIQAIASQTGDFITFKNSGGTTVLSVTVGGALLATSLTMQSSSTTAVTVGNGSSTLMTKSVTLTPQNAFQATSGNQLNTEVGSTFSPTSGTATFQGAKITTTINQTGGANGTVTDLLVAATETALVGAHNLIDLQVGGSPKLTISNAGTITFADAANEVYGTTTGTKHGTATTQKQSFWNATPVVQPASANQAALTDSTGGTADGTVADVGAVFSQSTLNNNFADITRLVNQLRNDLVTIGILKGSA